MLTRDQILNCQDLKKERVDVPEWGGEVYVKSLTALERDRFELQAQNKAVQNHRAFVVAMAVCDAEGNKLFTEADIVKLGNKSAAALARIFDVAVKLSRFTEEDIDQLEKN